MRRQETDHGPVTYDQLTIEKKQRPGEFTVTLIVSDLIVSSSELNFEMVRI